MNHNSLNTDWLSLKQAAEKLGMTVSGLDIVARNGLAPFQHIGPYRLVPSLWVECVAETGAPMRHSTREGRIRYDWQQAEAAYEEALDFLAGESQTDTISRQLVDLSGRDAVWA